MNTLTRTMAGSLNTSGAERLIFLTCLLGIPIYGATPAWYMLSSFDINNLVPDVNICRIPDCRR